MFFNTCLIVVGDAVVHHPVAYSVAIDQMRLSCGFDNTVSKLIYKPMLPS